MSGFAGGVSCVNIFVCNAEQAACLAFVLCVFSRNVLAICVFRRIEKILCDAIDNLLMDMLRCDLKY